MVEFLHDGHRRRVALVTNIPTPYRLVVYDLLSTEADIDLKLFYCSDREPNRDWDIAESSVPSHYLRENYITLANRVVHINLDIWPNLRSFKPEFVITSGFNPTHLVAMAYAWLNGAKLITMTDGTFRSEKELTLIHRLVRRLSFSRAHAFVGASESSFDMYKSYGIQPQRMFKSHLCANNPAFLSQHHAPKVVDFIFCGRLVGVKNPLFALDVARESARRLGRRVSIILVGSGQLEEAIRQQALVMHEDVDVHLPELKV